jgi:hypothetical protein
MRDILLGMVIVENNFHATLQVRDELYVGGQAKLEEPLPNDDTCFISFYAIMVEPLENIRHEKTS